MKKMVLLWLICFHTATLVASTQGVYILVHGTWGTDATWHQTSSDFYKVLEESAARHHKKIISFKWKGKFNHKTRTKAAKQLVKLIQSYPDETSINIISHSHGGNVGNIASQILGETEGNKHAIDCFYAFGTPIDIKKYMPNMNIIKRYFNFFSFSDWVQPIFGFCSRIYPKHNSIANLRIMVDCAHPSHRTILSPTVARWLPDFPDKLAHKKMGNFDHFNFTQPAVVHFSSAGCPTYSPESKRTPLIKPEAHALTLLASKIVHEKGHHSRA